MRPSWETAPHFGLWFPLTESWMLDCFDEPRTFATSEAAEAYLKLFTDDTRSRVEIRERRT